MKRYLVFVLLLSGCSSNPYQIEWKEAQWQDADAVRFQRLVRCGSPVWVAGPSEWWPECR